ncbi:MAG: SLC13/DASS family transporter [Gammaproteobacteria bacterium]|jgi:sodium-dependent dicarboxylate transporter 2/3/5|nr:SLC13/DASS family transporter [Gammaproteobacteria bacterium]MBT6073950.1 SLC13/DASS family transporter [Gammaproteobacteria bacterium]MBT7754151.1 SLC13/DASS family transporter [Gammaproteobacteria bacterium]MDG2434085.1 DASS family sodium-coupled anion symporter [Gammaproteobacteria bacterium]
MSNNKKSKVGFLVGLISAIIILILPDIESLPEEGKKAAAVFVWMAVWWATEAVPIAITALIPLVFFPLLGVSSIEATAAPYANKNIFLFLGGFFLSIAIQKCNLHKRMALTVLKFTGTRGKSIIGGFMLSSCILSMWIMNTSTTIMLLPIGLAIITVINESMDELSPADKINFQVALLLGIAYAANIGGIATLIGTAPNMALNGFMEEQYDVSISFLDWMKVGLPVSMLLLPLTWLSLTRFSFPVNFETSTQTQETIITMRNNLGKITTSEKRVFFIFIFTALLWISRSSINNIPGLEGLSDPGIAMLCGLILFLTPSGSSNDNNLLEWKDAEAGVPWGVLLLFGGGLSLAAAAQSSGLAAWIGGSMPTGLSIFLLVLLFTTLIIFLTELTSNLATTATFLPIVAIIATQFGFNPLLLTASIAIAASCAFMLPVATPPNAIVFGSELIKVPQMMRAGIAINFIAIIIVSLAGIYLVPYFLI